uniref:arginine decarboxylase-like n=1 Tax=Erigeron canadensis TaxID=72917 RepID=UPI001CB95ECA|nr:arginine decarboxylase-like [Erigeron canadensis]
MASGFLNLSQSLMSFSRSTSTACISEERNHGMPVKKHNNIGILDNGKFIKENTAISGCQVSDHHKCPPLVSALKASAEQTVARFHFPGHNRGRAAPSSLTRLIGIEPYLHDLPELPELDNLFAPEGPILDAQKQAAKLFGATETWFLVGGTTCGIQASIMATCSPGDTLILPRNSHISAFSSMVLSGAIPKYITPEYDFEWDIACGVTPSQVEKAINELHAEGRKASAVFITSPTYHGICSNLEKISLLCHSHDIPVIVDEAHGAHLGFHESFPRSALSQGADLSVQSTHKVLSSLTQSSMLHRSGNNVDRERVCQCLQTLQSTSPSYLLLASLDAARAQISEHPRTIFNKAVEIAMETKALIGKIPGIRVLDTSTFGMDPLRITVGVWKLGMSGFEADDILYEYYGVVSELAGTRSITFAINLGTSRDDVLRLVSGLKHLSQTHNSILLKEERLNDIQLFRESTTSMRLSPREAFFACKKKVGFKESVGNICGELVCPYPPGIPLLVPGEVVTEEALSYLMEVKKNGGFISGAADLSLSSITVCS